MATILKEKAIWFNDVILVPQLGEVESRKDVPRELYRLIASPMTSVVGPTFAKKATSLGLTVCIPRFFGIEKEVEIYNSCMNKDNLYFSIGLNSWDRVDEFKKTGCKNYLIDIANGYMPHIEDAVKKLVEKTEVENIILGNITTKTGFFHLADIIRRYGLKGIIRCGVSNGSGCYTYKNIGYGSGQLSELLDIAPHKKLYSNISISSDGGLGTGGFINKAFLAGSDYVFIGGLFAKSQEAETHISGDSTYFGLASDKNQILSTGKKFRHSEGKEYAVDNSKLQPLEEIVEEIWGYISSAVSWSGYSTLAEAIGNGVFQIKENSLPSRKK